MDAYETGNPIDHSGCVEVGAFSGSWWGHTHEGQAGWWLFPGEEKSPYDRS